MEVEVVGRNREVTEKIELKDSVFNAEVKDHLIHDVVVMHMAQRRSGNAQTKNRSMVKGSGSKPWRQKGTGRARIGTVRSPLWRGGGVVFGPSKRDYSYYVPKKVRKGALKSALSLRMREGALLVCQNLALKEPKTKEAVSLLRNLQLGDRKVLFIVAETERNMELAVRNLPGVNVLKAEGINTYDVMYHDAIVISPEAVRKIEEVL